MPEQEQCDSCLLEVGHAARPTETKQISSVRSMQEGEIPLKMFDIANRAVYRNHLCT